MSQFFKALQQAEQDRARRSRADNPKGGPRPSGESPRDSATESLEDLGASSVERRDGARTPSLRPAPGAGSEGVEEHLVTILKPSSFETEQYQLLADIVERFRASGSVKVVGVTSPSGGDGKTLTALNLVGALAQGRSHVLLVEADLRQPTVARSLGLADAQGGFVQAIAHPELSLADVVTRVSGVEFDVLTAGPPSSAPWDMLRSPRAERIFLEARQAYDYVVVDTPPIVAMPEARVIERLVDGFLLVVRAHQTRRHTLEEALRSLDRTKVLGLVFNEDDRMAQGLYRYYGYKAKAEETSRNGRNRRRGRPDA